jgi:hypothetical protein
MAPRKAPNPRKSAKAYRDSPSSRANKARYDTTFNEKPEQMAKRRELVNARRKRGMDGKGGPDLSHTKSGKLVKEPPSMNRARNRGKK